MLKRKKKKTPCDVEADICDVQFFTDAAVLQIQKHTILSHHLSLEWWAVKSWVNPEKWLTKAIQQWNENHLIDPNILPTQFFQG